MSALKRALPWEYCECGCKGSVVSVAGVHFWRFDDLKGTLALHKGHGHVSPLVFTVQDTPAGRAKITRHVKEALRDALFELLDVLGEKLSDD